MEFALALQVMLALRDMTRGDLAEALGTNRSTIWQIIRRGYLPPADTQQRIREILAWGEREDEALAMLVGEEVAA